MSLPQGESWKYNECNDDEDGYCIFEKDYKDLKERILNTGNQLELESLQRELRN